MLISKLLSSTAWGVPETFRKRNSGPTSSHASDAEFHV